MEKTGFKDVSGRNPEIGEKKGNHRIKKATGRYRMRRMRRTPQVMFRGASPSFPTHPSQSGASLFEFPPTIPVGIAMIIRKKGNIKE